MDYSEYDRDDPLPLPTTSRNRVSRSEAKLSSAQSSRASSRAPSGSSNGIPATAGLSSAKSKANLGKGKGKARRAISGTGKLGSGSASSSRSVSVSLGERGSHYHATPEIESNLTAECSDQRDDDEIEQILLSPSSGRDRVRGRGKKREREVGSDGGDSEEELRDQLRRHISHASATPRTMAETATNDRAARRDARPQRESHWSAAISTHPPAHDQLGLTTTTTTTMARRDSDVDEGVALEWENTGPRFGLWSGAPTSPYAERSHEWTHVQPSNSAGPSTIGYTRAGPSTTTTTTSRHGYLSESALQHSTRSELVVTSDAARSPGFDPYYAGLGSINRRQPASPERRFDDDSVGLSGRIHRIMDIMGYSSDDVAPGPVADSSAGTRRSGGSGEGSSSTSRRFVQCDSDEEEDVIEISSSPAHASYAQSFDASREPRSTNPQPPGSGGLSASQPSQQSASQPQPPSPTQPSQPSPTSGSSSQPQALSTKPKALEPTSPQPSHSESDASALSTYTCPICFHPPSNATLTPCGHICCGECLFSAVKTMMGRNAGMGGYPGPVGAEDDPGVARCPVCRNAIPGWDGRGGGVIGLKVKAFWSA